jgi:hypothetical protein
LILLSFIVALALLFTEYRLTARNMAVKWNGLGSINPVLSGDSVAPMQYRVFVPWLYRLFRFGDIFTRYLVIKGIGIWFALYAFSLFCGAMGVDPIAGMLLLAAVLPITFLYDYTDCYYDLGFLALAYTISLMGQQHLMWLVMITLLASLNRETGVFIPLGYFVLTGGIIGTVFLLGISIVGLIIPRAYYGKKPRYCSFSQWKRNIADLKRGFSIFHYLLSGLGLWFVGVGVYHVFTDPTDHLSMLFYLMCCFVMVLSIPSVWCEVRVFMPTFLVTIPLTIKLL